MIYIMLSANHVKVGYTADKKRLKARLKAIQIGNQHRVTLLAAVEGSQATEQRVHAVLGHARADGGTEWFDARDPVVNEFVSIAMDMRGSFSARAWCEAIDGLDAEHERKLAELREREAADARFAAIERELSHA